jgi:hypothetical protein
MLLRLFLSILFDGKFNLLLESKTFKIRVTVHSYAMGTKSLSLIGKYAIAIKRNLIFGDQVPT